MDLDSAIENQQWKEARDLLDRQREMFPPHLLNEHCDILHHAIINGAPADIITQLISPQFINIQARGGSTALYWAVMKERWELVPVLLQHGADINLPNRWNRTPLFCAVDHDAPADVVTQLVSPDNINMQEDDHGLTALHVAVRKKRWELMLVLLQHGADINMRDHIYGDTVLIQAVWEESWELVPVLIQYGADPSMLDSYQPDQPLVLSLKFLCITTIRSHMPVKSDAAYEGLGLPGKLVEEVKLRPQAEDIVKRYS